MITPIVDGRVANIFRIGQEQPCLPLDQDLRRLRLFATPASALSASNFSSGPAPASIFARAFSMDWATRSYRRA